MFPHVTIAHIRTAAHDTWKGLVIFSRYFWFFLVVFFGWSKEFPKVGGFYLFFIPKVIIIIVGSLLTPIPLWVLLILAFVPPPIVLPIFFVSFIVMFAH